MTEVTTSVIIDLSGLKRFKKSLAAQMSSPSDASPVGKMLMKWAIRYRSFAQLRFNAHSRGQGDWPPLAPSTIAKRRGKGQASILRDTGILFAALTPTWQAPPGGVNQYIPYGVRVGFGGSASHPEGHVTIAAIAGFHQVGGGNLPKREIIVDPPASVISGCAQDAEAALEEL